MAQCRELRITDQKAIQAFSEQTKIEAVKSGTSNEMASLKIRAAAEDYESAKPNLEYAFGWEKFFGEGHWAKRQSWTWKAGREPTVNGKPKNPVDKLRAELAAEGVETEIVDGKLVRK